MPHKRRGDWEHATLLSARGIVANKMRKKKVKTMYSDKKFNELINSYYEYKDKHPYRGAEWRANGENARACVGILTQIGEQIRQLINDENLVHGYHYEVHVSQGVGCFPRSPWVGLLFNNERPTHGVYPVFGFFNNDAGCYLPARNHSRVKMSLLTFAIWRMCRLMFQQGGIA